MVRRGENLATGYANVTAAVDAWGNERADYSFKGTETGFSEQTGHFTQLVWKSTNSVGCAAVNCSASNTGDITNGYYLVCEYYPAGNIVGQNNQWFQENVQSQIHSSGPTGTVTASGAASSSTGIGSGTGAVWIDRVRMYWTIGVGIVALTVVRGLN